MVLLHYNSKSKNGKNGGSKIITMVEHLWGHGRYIYIYVSHFYHKLGYFYSTCAGWSWKRCPPLATGWPVGEVFKTTWRSPLNKEFKIDISAWTLYIFQDLFANVWFQKGPFDTAEHNSLPAYCIGTHIEVLCKPALLCSNFQSSITQKLSWVTSN